MVGLCVGFNSVLLILCEELLGEDLLHVRVDHFSLALLIRADQRELVLADLGLEAFREAVRVVEMAALLQKIVLRFVQGHITNLARNVLLLVLQWSSLVLLLLELKGECEVLIHLFSLR